MSPLRPTMRFVPILLLSIAACMDEGADADTDAVVERETIGDTTIVRTVSGSAWGDTARLVEEVRIGALEGREELTFGRVGRIAAGPDGSIFVFDEQAVAIRQFDSTGAFVRTIGRRGQGPGEHQAILGLAVMHDGRLAAYDVRNQRINFYSLTDESSDSWPVRTGSAMLFAPHSFTVDTAGRMYVLTIVREGTEPTSTRSRQGYLRITPGDSVVDTLLVPTFPPPPQSVRLSPRGQWVMHPHGYFVAGMNDRYSFDALRPEGVLRIQRTASAPEFVAEERSEWEAQLAAGDPDILSVSVTRGKAPEIVYGDKPTLAKAKPVYQSLAAGEDGRIWVRLHTRARKTEGGVNDGPPPMPIQMPGQRPPPPPRLWREPTVYDVFEPDGRYLGPVTVPDGVTLFVMRGNQAWGTVRGESDEEYIVRLRMNAPRS